MNYPVILLDADDTLLDFQKAEDCAIRQVLRERGIPDDDAAVARYSAVNRRWWEAFERGDCAKEDLVWRRFVEFFSLYGCAADPREANAAYRQGLGGYAFLLPGAVELLRELRRRGHRLYLVTNGTASVQNRRLKDSGLDQLLDGVFISEDMGTQKPHKAFFDQVLHAIGRPDTAECIILGDSQTSDMQGGKNAGIATCWFNPGGQRAKDRWDYEISALPDFLNIV